MGRQVRAQSFMEETKLQLIMNIKDNWLGGDKGRQLLEDALTMNKCRIRNGSGMFENWLRDNFDRSWKTVMVGKEGGANPWWSLSARLMNTGFNF